MKLLTLSTLVMASIGLWAAPTRAADLAPAPTALPSRGTSDLYIVTLTANGQAMPRFPGSDRFTGIGFPSVTFRRSDEPARFSAPDDGISLSFLDRPDFRIGVVGRYVSGRYLSDDRRLVGLRKVDWDIEPGFFIEYFPVSFLRARLEVRHGVRDGIGFSGNAGIDAIQPVDRFTFSVGPRLSFGDDSFVRRYFGVTATEAALNGRVTPFRPDGGLTGVGALGAVTCAWSDRVSTTAYAQFTRLVEDAGRSPIPKRLGSDDQFVFGASLSYSFAVSPSRLFQ